MEEKVFFRILRRMWYEKHYQGRQPALMMRKYFSAEKFILVRDTQPKDWARFKLEAEEWMERRRAKMN